MSCTTTYSSTNSFQQSRSLLYFLWRKMRYGSPLPTISSKINWTVFTIDMKENSLLAHRSHWHCSILQEICVNALNTHPTCSRECRSWYQRTQKFSLSAQQIYLSKINYINLSKISIYIIQRSPLWPYTPIIIVKWSVKGVVILIIIKSTTEYNI